MALKPDRWEFKTDISYFCNDVTERGVILQFGTSGSGVALDQTKATVSLPGVNVTGVNIKAAGLLLNDMVNVDQTRYHINYLKDEMQKGGKCTLLQKGWVVTNMVTGTPVAGDPAYLATSGLVSPTQATGPASSVAPKVGTFLSAKDEKGYAKLEIDLP
jgi:hypothetical protein